MACLNYETLPSLASSFVDTFVDFTVSGGLFLPTDPYPHLHPFHNYTVFPHPTLLIPIRDIHGVLSKAKQALTLVSLIDPNNHWVEGTTTVIQVGDILDRGGDEIKLLYLFEKLKREAANSDGRIITMNRSHEIMNVDGDFRYFTVEGLQEFENGAMWQSSCNLMKKICNVEVNGDVCNGVSNEFARIKLELQKGVRARVCSSKA